jgi:hypothetical protein
MHEQSLLDFLTSVGDLVDGNVHFKAVFAPIRVCRTDFKTNLLRSVRKILEKILEHFRKTLTE